MSESEKRRRGDQQRAKYMTVAVASGASGNESRVEGLIFQIYLIYYMRFYKLYILKLDKHKQFQYKMTLSEVHLKLLQKIILKRA